MCLTLKIRKRPIVVEAFKVHLGHCRGEEFIPFKGIKRKEGFAYLEVETLYGVVKVNTGHWIVKGVNGEVYPIHEDILFKTYEFMQKPKEKDPLVCK